MRLAAPNTQNVLHMPQQLRHGALCKYGIRLQHQNYNQSVKNYRKVIIVSLYIVCEMGPWSHAQGTYHQWLGAKMLIYIIYKARNGREVGCRWGEGNNSLNGNLGCSLVVQWQVGGLSYQRLGSIGRLTMELWTTSYQEWTGTLALHVPLPTGGLGVNVNGRRQ